MDDYLIGIIIMVCIYGLVGLSAYLLLISGQISFGQQAYFGIGAYVGGMATTLYGASLVSAIIIAGTVAGVVAGCVGVLTVRLGGLYYAIATLAFAEIARLTWVNLHFQVEVGGHLVGPLGPEGFRGIRYLIERNISSAEYMWFVLLCVAVVVVFFVVLERSRVGLNLRMIDNDDVAAASLGIDPTTYKVGASAAAGVVAALGGVLFAHYMTFIDPANFGVMVGVHALAYGMIGGLGTFLGPLIGATLDIALLESLRVLAGYRMIIFGLLVVLILIVRPRGILDEATLHRAARAIRVRTGRSVYAKDWRSHER